jgi:hypothetical protein
MLICLQLFGPYNLIKTAVDLCNFGMMLPIAGLVFGCENLASSSVDWFIVLDKHGFQVIDFFT